MTVELSMLVYSVGLLVVLIAIQASAGVLANGLLYPGGVPWIRPLAWIAGMAGCIFILVALL